MDSSQAVYNGMKKAGINFIVSVPCVNLSTILKLIDKDPEITHVPVTREEEGLGICAGAYLAGKKTAILMQNSGLGNSINALASLYELYKLPLIMIMSHRGVEGESICGQIPMGLKTPKLLDSMEIKHYTPQTPTEAEKIISKSWNQSQKEETPLAILLEIKYWEN